MELLKENVFTTAVKVLTPYSRDFVWKQLKL